MTGGPRHAAVAATGWKVDRPAPATVNRQGFEPHAAQARTPSSLKPIGHR
jgi:hypothetical protein